MTGEVGHTRPWGTWQGLGILFQVMETNEGLGGGKSHDQMYVFEGSVWLVGGEQMRCIGVIM